VVVIALVTGCGPRDDDPAIPAPPTEVRHDVDPLTSRFPVLGTPVSASWVTWNSSDPNDRSIPGPSTSWIDAVVHLDPNVTTNLVAQYVPIPEEKKPDVQQLLRPELPPGPFLTSARLDLAFTTAALASSAFLDPMANVLVLVSTSM
jgi:hypothetical protein